MVIEKNAASLREDPRLAPAALGTWEEEKGSGGKTEGGRVSVLRSLGFHSSER